MLNNSRAVLSNLSDPDNLKTYVENNHYVYIRDRPAVDHLIYQDYKERREKNSMSDEKVHCPFATSKYSFMRRKRTFAYQPNTTWNALFDPE